MTGQVDITRDEKAVAHRLIRHTLDRTGEAVDIDHRLVPGVLAEVAAVAALLLRELGGQMGVDPEVLLDRLQVADMDEGTA